MEKLIIITRADLPPGAQLAQSCHAAAEYSVTHSVEFARWAKDQRNIVCLSVPDEQALEAIEFQANQRLIHYAAFREPDFGESLTALALGEGGGALTSTLPLALRAKKGVARSSELCDPGPL